MSHTFTRFQRDWLDALKSGRFRQGRTFLALQRPDGNRDYCCLGVACVIYKTFPDLPTLSETLQPSGSVVFGQSNKWLSSNVEKALGLISCIGLFKNPAIVNGQTFHSLARMNDSGIPHKDIAKYIEENPENVFVQPTT